MPDATDSFNAIRNRIEAGSLNPPIWWPNEEENSDGEKTLPDTPAAFIHIAFHTDRGYLAAFGGGNANNLWRNQGLIEAYYFVPRGEGLDAALDGAETIATLFRGYRTETVSCFDASVRAGTSASNLNLSALNQETQTVADNYHWAVTQVSFHYDQIG